VVGALWNVQDAPTKELLVNLHRHYRDGHDAASSLRLAQLDLLERDKRALKAVTVWSPFQVVGHASSPFRSIH
jgi:CHAT domain-containing protein